ncbi:hypothetical protein OH76DRAFT_555431 [Lentinus brumalis]|uniref:Uncharacterized protein n=1 Tax=Lentinus brumalis TaxID=2498619 RepID=A0A371D978_9APHY|nr:hypothetical protein OH76DRAFT_555431 [Polyporus brumalis]
MRNDLEHVSEQRLILTRHSGRAPTETSPRIRGHRSRRPLGCCNIGRIATPGSRSPASFSTTTAHRFRAPATPTGDRHYGCGQRAHSIYLRWRILQYRSVSNSTTPFGRCHRDALCDIASRVSALRMTRTFGGLQNTHSPTAGRNLEHSATRSWQDHLRELRMQPWDARTLAGHVSAVNPAAQGRKQAQTYSYLSLSCGKSARG